MTPIQKNNIYEYRDQACEVSDIRATFGRKVITVRILKTGEYKTVSESELSSVTVADSSNMLRFLALAAKIKAEMQQQGLLAPFESSIVPLPHQILALEKVMAGQHLRFLMADEVGMGKTIETGLVLKELKLRGIVKKALVIVPKSAMYQWKTEMKKHFNEDFHIYDTELINTLSRTFTLLEADSEVNIWQQHQQIIISTDALRPLESRSGWSREKVAQYNRFRIESVIEADFDLLIIDECHKVGGSSQAVSRYTMADTLCSAIPNLLLLSATPHRGKSDHFRRILQLLDSDAFAGEGAPSIAELEPYVVRTEKRQAIDYLGKPLFNKRRTERIAVAYDTDRHRKQTALYTAVTAYVRDGFNLSVQNKNNSYGFVMLLFQRMLSSSTQALIDAMQRRIDRLKIMAEDTAAQVAAQRDTLGGMTDEEDEDAQLSLLEGAQSLKKDEIATLKTLLQQAIECRDEERDAKVEYLLQALNDLKRSEGDPFVKYLIFTEFTGTQKMLLDVLTNIGGYKCVGINGSMGFEQRVSALKQFKEAAQIMVSTDAAGESLNMQFAHIIVNYDMPWNPMVIEQRIGRVDRIGQPKEVVALNLMLDNSVDRRVYEVISTKLDQILGDLGIDKSADVLDSTIETDKLNKLYLTSLLNPEQFEQESSTWLADIKAKLNNYKSTEGALPSLDDKQITIDSTNQYKNSPLATWLKNMTLNFLATKNIPVQLLTDGVKFQYPMHETQVYTFDVKETLLNPVPEPLTLQHSIIQDMLREALPHHAEQSIMRIAIEGQSTAGYWSLWQIIAKNGFEQQVQTVPMFISDEGDVFMPFGKKIWDICIDEKSVLHTKGLVSLDESLNQYEEMLQKAEEQLADTYALLEQKLQHKTTAILQNKEKAYTFQHKQLRKIGIDNIRKTRLSRLEKEFSVWKNRFNVDKTVYPDLICLQILKIEAS